MPVHEGLVESKRLYNDAKLIPTYGDADYWIKGLYVAFAKAVHATYIYMSRHGEESEIEHLPHREILDSVRMDAQADLDEWADKILKERAK